MPSSPTSPAAVVLTRAPEDNAPLAARLRAAGVAVLEWPALATAPVPVPGGWTEVEARLLDSEWVVFTSRRGVEALLALAPSHETARGLLAGRRLAAVGPATAEALREAGLAVHLVGDGSGALALVPGLVQDGSRIALVRSVLADEDFPASLRAAGVVVHDLKLHGPVEPAPQRHGRQTVAAVACASPSAARRVLEWNPWLAEMPFVAIGPTTARALREELHVERVQVAPSPDDDGLFAALLAASCPAPEVKRMDRSRSEAAHARATKLSPGGVHSPVRAFRAVGGTPVYFARAEGSRVIDVDGNAYVDTCFSWGPLILGHAHPAVVAAVRDAAGRGLSFGASHPGEADLAEAVLAGFPEFGRVRFVSSGTEAVMTALRLARGATGRNLVLKFEGGYHGHLDSLLVSAGSGLATFGTASSAGIPPAVAATTLVAPFDDETRLEELFHAHGKDIACVAVEPVPANDGLLLQRREWLATLRRLCSQHGALLLFDEVISGFRQRYGGVGPIYGVQPDLVTLGKIVGGGMPVGAVTGPADLMERLAPLGPVYQAGTLSGNPVAMAAGRATLELLRDGTAYATLEQLGARFQERLLGAGAKNVRLARMGSILWPYFGEHEPPRRPDRIEPLHVERFRRMHGPMLDRGFYLPPSAREVLFLSTAHSPEEVDGLADALAAEAARSGG